MQIVKIMNMAKHFIFYLFNSTFIASLFLPEYLRIDIRGIAFILFYCEGFYFSNFINTFFHFNLT